MLDEEYRPALNARRAAIIAKLPVPDALYGLMESIADLRIHIEYKLDIKNALKSLDCVTENWRQLKDALGFKEGWITEEIKENYKQRLSNLFPNCLP
jgi:hypothetical protein